MAKDIITIQFGAKGDQDVIKAINKLDRSTRKLISTQQSLTNANTKSEKETKKTSKAMKRMDIRLRALGVNLNKINIDTRTLTQAYSGNKVAIEKVRISVNKFIASQKKATTSTRILGGTLAVLRSKMLLFNFAMALGTRQVLRFATESARVESMSIAFDTLSGGVGNASFALDDLKKATNDTMSEFDLFQQANNAMILGVADNSETMSEMFDIAQRLGRALGRDTATSVESLITGIGRQSRLMLDNIGIIVKSEEAYEKYAKKLKTTVDRLTDAEKKTAFLEATMESARKKVETLGEETFTTQDNFDQLGTAFTNFTAAVTSNSKALNFFSIKIKDLLVTLTEAVSPLDKIDTLNNKLLFQYNSLSNATRILESGQTQLHKSAKIDIVLATKKIKAIEDELAQIAISASTAQLATMEKNRLNEADKEAIKLASEKAFQEKKTNDSFLASLFKRSERNKAIQAELTEVEKTQQEARDENNASYIAQIDERRERDLQIIEDRNEAFEQEQEQIKATQKAKIEAEKKVAEVQASMEQNRKDAQQNAVNGVRQLADFYSEAIERRKNNELNALRATNKFQNASSEERENMENQLNKSMAQQEIKLFRMKQLASLGQAAINTAEAVTKAVTQSPATGGMPASGIALAIGAIQAGVIASQPPPKYEQGGLVGGQRHAQGGTMIEAESGEFVMSRQAVQSIGLDSLNNMNQGGGSAININISAPLVDESVVNHIIPAIEKAVKRNQSSLVTA